MDLLSPIRERRSELRRVRKIFEAGGLLPRLNETNDWDAWDAARMWNDRGNVLFDAGGSGESIVDGCGAQTTHGVGEIDGVGLAQVLDSEHSLFDVRQRF